MSSLKELLPTILDKTREAKLEWEEFSDINFGAVLGPLTISVEKKAVRSTKTLSYVTRYTLSLRNHSGAIIDQLTGIDNDVSDQLREIYETARRRAYRVDESLDELKDLLGNL